MPGSKQRTHASDRPAPRRRDDRLPPSNGRVLAAGAVAGLAIAAFAFAFVGFGLDASFPFPLPAWLWWLALLSATSPPGHLWLSGVIGTLFAAGSWCVPGLGRAHRVHPVTLTLVLMVAAVNVARLAAITGDMARWQGRGYVAWAWAFAAIGPVLVLLPWVRGGPRSFEAAVSWRAVLYAWLVLGTFPFAGELNL